MNAGLDILRMHDVDYAEHVGRDFESQAVMEPESSVRLQSLPRVAVPKLTNPILLEQFSIGYSATVLACEHALSITFGFGNNPSIREALRAAQAYLHTFEHARGSCKVGVTTDPLWRLYGGVKHDGTYMTGHWELGYRYMRVFLASSPEVVSALEKILIRYASSMANVCCDNVVDGGGHINSWMGLTCYVYIVMRMFWHISMVVLAPRFKNKICTSGPHIMLIALHCLCMVVCVCKFGHSLPLSFVYLFACLGSHIICLSSLLGVFRFPAFPNLVFLHLLLAGWALSRLWKEWPRCRLYLFRCRWVQC